MVAAAEGAVVIPPSAGWASPGYNQGLMDRFLASTQVVEEGDAKSTGDFGRQGVVATGMKACKFSIWASRTPCLISTEMHTPYWHATGGGVRGGCQCEGGGAEMADGGPHQQQVDPCMATCAQPAARCGCGPARESSGSSSCMGGGGDSIDR
ncbi:hypothetical protein TSOC_006029 [Tetrabaena socialis]|uniref:Uncharacterized protein n=1 Tax=Tetrabaena socialis TaxID=47790 RepID=A0A2J8A4S6_9CHLO|nr:hypothetical protein TSOC_006029 [Tetrabaena socialis]|eukprot:PNH07521.1 hypothetical protein TSOC_006029 [Tetrabaena socialis]